MKKLFLCYAAVLLIISVTDIYSQTSLTAVGVPVTQNFNTLSNGGSGYTWTDNITLPGWYVITETQTPTTYRANTGSSAIPLLYSFGSTGSTDRALGYSPGATYTGPKGYMGWRLKNNTTQPIGSIRVVWTGEQWRKAAIANKQYIRMSYQIGSSVTSLISGTYTLIPAPNFESPVADGTMAVPTDGNGSAYRTAGITIDIDVTIAPGEEIMLRWEDTNDSPSNHLLAIDDVTVTATKFGQIITFPSLTDKNVGETAFNPGATSTSGLTVSYSSDNTAVATISGNLVTPVGPGTATITATQPGNETYTAAVPVQRILTVRPLPPVATAATEVGIVTFRANWTPASGVDGYYLYVTEDPTFETYNEEWVGNVNSYIATGLNPSTTYYYRLKSLFGETTSEFSNTITVNTVVGTQVCNIIATPSYRGANITWTNGDLGARVVFMKEGSGPITMPVNHFYYLPSSDWSDKGEQLGNSGYFCVYNGTGNSVSITNLNPATLYTVQAFEYSGGQWNESYITTITGANNPIPFTTMEAIWVGSVSSDWNTAGNWKGNGVPVVDANIYFDATAIRDCLLDNDKSIHNFESATTRSLVLNGHKLIIKGLITISNGAQINASASGSEIEFAGSSEQYIQPGIFTDNKVYDLTINNPANVILEGTLNLLNTITNTSGYLDAINTGPTLIFGGPTAQVLDANQYQDRMIYNLTSDNAAGLTLINDLEIYSDLVINSGKKLTVAAGKTLIAGYILNNAGVGGLVLDADATNGEARLYNNTEGVQGTVKLFLSTGAAAWHDVSPPVSGALPSVFSNLTDNVLGFREADIDLTLNDGWCWYDGIEWDGVSGDGFSTLDVGAGYGVYDEVNRVYTFTGILNADNISIVLSKKSPNADLGGLNLIGNPFPCSIDWDYVINAPSWDARISKAIHFSQNNTQVSWVNGVSNPIGATTSYIPPMQAFFVETTADGASINLDNMAKSFNMHARYKGSAASFSEKEVGIPLLRFRFEDDDATIKDETVIRFDDEASMAFDNDFDALKIMPKNDQINVWTSLNKKDYSINGVPFPDPGFIIPIKVIAPAAGIYKLTAFSIEGLEDYDLFLEDKVENTQINIKDISEYSFLLGSGLTPDRFVLRSGNVATGIEDPINNIKAFSIYISKGALNIAPLSDKWSSNKGNVRIYDVTGKLMNNFSNQAFEKGSIVSYPIKGMTGIYIIEITSGYNRYTEKISVF